ncbi:MAG: hypothetical protein C3F02_04570 [Parcubacteria group bacterium]|nr:MAG: hypothetical protein C3F02_04570 [Parcubacteria group bacterium]
MAGNSNFQKIGDLFQGPSGPKPPAYQWQDLALKIIADLNVPNYKRNSVFKICKENSRELVEKCLDDTKELATGESWKYFFKLAAKKK